MELSTGNAPFAHVQLVLAHPRHPCWLRKPRLVTQFNLVRASTGNALGQSRVDRLCRPSLSTVSVSFEAANESFRLLVLSVHCVCRGVRLRSLARHPRLRCIERGGLNMLWLWRARNERPLLEFEVSWGGMLVIGGTEAMRWDTLTLKPSQPRTF